jgi:hypothetical protein
MQTPMNRTQSAICLIALILAFLAALLLPALIEPTGPLHALFPTGAP